MSNTASHTVKNKAVPQQVQTKLQVNEPGDVYEQEADAMANRVMRMADGNAGSPTKPVTGLIGRSVQRKCAHCEEEEKRQVMRKTESGTGGMAVSSSFSSSLQATKGSGTPLPSATRSFMEHAFSTDFSEVKIHTGSQAAEMNQGINARAFTHGSDIYFNSGEYSSNTAEGKKLLAHELTHVLQQNNSIQPRLIQRQHQPAPTVNRISVHFDNTIVDRGYVVPTGTAVAHFSNRHTSSTSVSGGSVRPGYGMTRRADNLIFRIEDAGYINEHGDAMPYALFYSGAQAIHIGSLSRTSHGCVHVNNRPWMRTINNASVLNQSSVRVVYDDDVWTQVSRNRRRVTP